jgi:hypothetical protein
MNSKLDPITKETNIDILAEDLYNITGKELGYTNISDWREVPVETKQIYLNRIKELYD